MTPNNPTGSVLYRRLDGGRVVVGLMRRGTADVRYGIRR